MYDGCGEIDHSAEAFVGFVGTHRDAFEFLELTEEILDQVPPFIHFPVKGSRL